VKALIYSLQVTIDASNADRDILSPQIVDQNGKALSPELQAALHRDLEAETQLIEALVTAIDSIAEPGQNGFRRETSVALSCMHHMKATGSVHTRGEDRDSVFDAVLRNRYQLSSRGRSGSAQVGDEVRNREVGLMTDSRHNRKFRGRDSACERFVVESREIFQ
jgi:hypothetical protein